MFIKVKLLLLLLLIFLETSFSAAFAEDEEKYHVVIVVGTQHYSPHLTMPVLAKEIEKLGFRTTLVMGQGDPEKKKQDVLPNIEVLKDADLAIFFMRFLTLPDEELKPITDYVKSGKPVIGLRTANHSFKYPADHKRSEWNDGFGRRVLGTPYVVHQQSKTSIRVLKSAREHPILKNVRKQEWTSFGKLYLTRLEPGCVPLVMGTGNGKPKTVTRSFGQVQVKEQETDVVAWTWENEWGGRVFATSFGHVRDFEEEAFMRMLINSVYWSLDLPLPDANTRIPTWKTQIP